MSGEVVIRERRPEDVPPLVALLLRQQPQTRYPLRDPLPFPPEQFLHAHDAAAAWVAELDGSVVGHVCRTGGRSGTPEDEQMRAAAALAHGCTEAELGWVSTLYVDLAWGGRGIGRLLLDTVTAAIQELGLRPALEVLPLHAAALALYESAGWRTVTRARPAWLRGALGDDGPDVQVMVLPTPDRVGVVG